MTEKLPGEGAYVSGWTDGPEVTLSMGMGVDSAALLTRWLLDPASRLVPHPATGELVPFTLDRLTAVTAMTGDEYVATARAMEQHLLPLMARHAVRYVQVCRAGQSDTDGIRVLSDSTATTRMFMRGPWRLADELSAAGTVPQVAAGKRLCSYRAKGWVLDQWAALEYAGRPRAHVIGFAAEETGRARRDSSYTQACRTPDYPLIRWGWDRGRCAVQLRDLFGIDWPRSCCGYCPFQAGPDIVRLRERWLADPDAAVQALVLEAVAVALNPRMALFGDRTARQVAAGFGLGHLIRAADVQVDAMPAALYEVRRVFRRAGDQSWTTAHTKDERKAWRTAHPGEPVPTWQLGPDPAAKGQVWRSLRQVRTDRGWPVQGARHRLVRHLCTRARRGGELDLAGAAARLWFERAGAPYPATEHYLTVAPAGINDKERASFAELWEYAATLDLPRQADLMGV
jgi:hypothetical protein